MIERRKITGKSVNQNNQIKPVLTSYINDLSLPEADLVDENFSSSKRLYKYQVSAIENALKILYLYFNQYNQNKEDFSRLYPEEYRKKLSLKLKEKAKDLISSYFKFEKPEKDEGTVILPFSEICNRAGFWMATGSGKTLVIVKLVELLYKLMENGIIPRKEVMFLTAREDLLEVFKKYVEEFNQGRPLNEQIAVKDLLRYEEEIVSGELRRRIFLYRSDLISDENKEKIVNFERFLSYDGDRVFGNWYLILDEAHKGDQQESKRKLIFCILSQEGFLFNFSATFTDPVDIATTIFNLNLKEFLSHGYGKNIYVLQKEVKGFKKEEEEDFTAEQKRKAILSSLVLLTCVKKAFFNIKSVLNGEKVYHNPLGIYLVNSVNVEDADLVLLFNEIAQLARKIPEDFLNEVKNDLIEEFKEFQYTLGQDDLRLYFLEEFIKKITPEDIYRAIFNAPSPGEVEYLYSEENDQEIALKLTSSDFPFALIKIGNIRELQKTILCNYRENKLYKNPEFFKSLNDESSSINLLIGSRSFYEGWDSNRPNVITYINIGMKADARKFILQSVGRGVRIEPVAGQRKRFLFLIPDTSNSEVLKILRDKFEKEVCLLETLFVFATRRDAVRTVLEELIKIKNVQEFRRISFKKNPELEAGKYVLLIPRYVRIKKPVTEIENPPKFELSEVNYELMNLYLKYVPAERFIIEWNTCPVIFDRLRKIFNEKNKFFKLISEKHYRDWKLLLKKLIDYVSVEIEDSDPDLPFEEVNDKIVHFKEILVEKAYFSELEEKIKLIVESKELTLKEITLNELILKKLINHFYIPIAYSEKPVEWIKHVIKTESEVKFLNALEEKIEFLNELCEWWFFSKLDETLDKIYIPYMDEGKLRKFVPDFIFWFKLKNSSFYVIEFVDPKSTVFTNYQQKIEGYKRIFCNNNQTKLFSYNNFKVIVRLKMFTGDKSGIHNVYLPYWYDSSDLFEDLEKLASTLNSFE